MLTKSRLTDVRLEEIQIGHKESSDSAMEELPNAAAPSCVHCPADRQPWELLEKLLYYMGKVSLNAHLSLVCL